nr:MAG TPA: minor structural protein [Caudoviricetes sp.]
MSDGQQQDPNTNAQGVQEPPIDWHDKFLGQKKVNTDLEAKLKAAREKADRVDDLEKQVADWEQRGKEFDSTQAAIAGLQKQVLQANVTAAATGKLINPSDALKLIDFSDLTADDQGGYDQQAIGEKIDALVTAHPYLAQGGNKAGLTGIIPPSGARDGDHQAGQLTRDDLKNMTSKQIDEARRKGRLDDLLAGRAK